eukprot:2922935-Amphidinium_carterae.1
MDVSVSKSMVMPSDLCNHYLPSPPHDNGPIAPFVMHLAGRSNEYRMQHFKQVKRGAHNRFAHDKYSQFWSFYRVYQLFKAHARGNVCVLGLGQQLFNFLDALFFHFVYLNVFTFARTSLPTTREIAKLRKLYPARWYPYDISVWEDPRLQVFANGRIHCDLFLLGAESMLH